MTVPSSSTSIENKGAKRIQPKTECEKDVLLLPQNSDLPQLKEGNRYRVRAGGSAHANSGEGYAIYVYGKLPAESKGGGVAWRREGGRPRGGHNWPLSATSSRAPR